MLLNARDFPSLQAALDMASDGDAIYVPHEGIGTPISDLFQVWTAPPGGWHIRKSICLFGDGPGVPGSAHGTTFSPAPDNTPVFVIDPTTDGATIVLHSFKITNLIAPSSYTAGANGIAASLASGQRIRSLLMKHVVVLNMAGNGVDLGAGAGQFDRVDMTFCFATNCQHTGYVFDRIGQVRLQHCGGGGHTQRGGAFSNTLAACYGLAQENVGVKGPPPSDGVLLFDGCPMAAVECRLEYFYDGIHIEAGQEAQRVNRVGCEFRGCGGAAFVGSSHFFQFHRQFDPMFPDRILDMSPSTGIKASGKTGVNGHLTLFPNTFVRIAPGIVSVSADVMNVVTLPQVDDRANVTSRRGDVPVTLGFPYVSRFGNAGAAPSSTAGLSVGDSGAVDPPLGPPEFPVSGTLVMRGTDLRLYGPTSSWHSVQVSP
jgi:hypothetical protein